MKVLEEGMDRMGLTMDEEKISLLKKYITELETWNTVYGLVHARGNELVIRHILDSLSGVNTIEKLAPPTIGDIGSGAGLPGVPLAVMLPGIRFYLVERSAKRCGFLRNVILTMGLRNVLVLEEELEKVTHRFSLAVFRGLAPLQAPFIKSIRRIIREDSGMILAYKGRREQIRKELECLRADKPGNTGIFPVAVPFLKEERNLILMSWGQESDSAV